MSSCRVLLVYPNERDMSLVPPVFGLFAALLRAHGHVVDMFDCTGYDFEGKVDTELDNERTLFNKPVEPSSYKGVKVKQGNMYDDFAEKVQSFSPDLIGMSVTESTFLRGVTLLDDLRSKKNIEVLTIVGGVFPTFAPDRVMRETSVDMVCVGEGDYALVKLADHIRDSKDFSKIENLWVRKSNGTIIKNAPGKAVDINSLPPMDFTVFSDDRFFRPMRGSIYRMLPVETHRGCPFTCTFCNSPSQNDLYSLETQSKFFEKSQWIKFGKNLLTLEISGMGSMSFFGPILFLHGLRKNWLSFVKCIQSLNSLSGVNLVLKRCQVLSVGMKN